MQGPRGLSGSKEGPSVPMGTLCTVPGITSHGGGLALCTLLPCPSATPAVALVCPGMAWTSLATCPEGTGPCGLIS